MASLRFVLDKQADAKNRYDSANGSNYGADRSKNIPTPILEKIKWKSQQEATQVLKPILEKRYEINKVLDIIEELNKWWENNWAEVFRKMENIVGKSIPVEEIKAKITTTARCPYNAKEWFFMYSPFRHGEIKSANESINIAMHELLHMMLHYYYEDYILAQWLTKEQFHELKEAQTVILNEEYDGLFTETDKGYDLHKYLREKFAEFRKNNKNFDDFVDYGIKLVKEASSVK